MFKLGNSYKKNEPIFLIWIVCLYGLSHFFCLMPVVRQILGSWTELEANPWFLVGDVLVIIVLFAWFNRIPEAGKLLRGIWRNGRWLLTFAYLWSAGILVWLNKAALFNSDHRHFLAVTVLLLLDAFFITYLLSSRHLKALFASFPLKDEADRSRLEVIERAKNKREKLLAARLALPIAVDGTSEAQFESQLRASVLADPSNSSAWFELGALAYQCKKTDQALVLMEKALESDSNSSIVLRSLCELSRQMGRVNEAVRYGREAVALAPEDEIAQLNLALALTDAKELDRAITHYHRVLDLNPHHMQAWLNLSSLLAQRNRKEDALAALDAVLLIDPNQANALSLKQQLIKS